MRTDRLAGRSLHNYTGAASPPSHLQEETGRAVCASASTCRGKGAHRGDIPRSRRL